MPDEMRNEFLDLLVHQVISHNDAITSKNVSAVPLQDEESEQITLKYYLLIAYMQKPSLIS